MKGSKGSESTNTGLTPTYIKGITWFFGIGINKYKNFSQLYNAVKDVLDFEALLRKRYEVFEESRSKVLRNGEATIEKILDYFDHLRKNVKESDRLIIYYSGHGHCDKASGRGFWIPVDAKIESRGLYIHNSCLLYTSPSPRD